MPMTVILKRLVKVLVIRRLGFTNAGYGNAFTASLIEIRNVIRNGPAVEKAQQFPARGLNPGLGRDIPVRGAQVVILFQFFLRVGRQT